MSCKPASRRGVAPARVGVEIRPARCPDPERNARKRTVGGRSNGGDPQHYCARRRNLLQQPNDSQRFAFRWHLRPCRRRPASRGDCGRREFRQHPAFPANELDRFTAVSKETRASTNSFLTAILAATDSPHRRWVMNRSTDTNEQRGRNCQTGLYLSTRSVQGSTRNGFRDGSAPI